MSAETLLALAERCEQATGPDRELDCAIYDALFVKPGKWDTAYSAKVFTASLDAAMTLVPKGTGYNLDRYWSREGERWKVEIATGGIPEAPRRVFDCWDAYTASLATCAAALRARAA